MASDQEILERAIQKAEANGWFLGNEFDDDEIPAYEVIFDHGFAKALWGKAERDWDGDGYMTSDWQYHLQNMVIAPDPITYLAENI